MRADALEIEPGAVRPLRTTLVFRPMPYEVDFTGILSNTVALCWMEALRVTLMDTHFSSFAMDDARNLSVITQAHVHYLQPIRYSDKVHGQVWIERVQGSRFVVAYEFAIQERGQVAVRATQTGAFLESKSFQPVPVPAELVAAVRAHGIG